MQEGEDGKSFQRMLGKTGLRHPTWWQ